MKHLKHFNSILESNSNMTQKDKFVKVFNALLPLWKGKNPPRFIEDIFNNKSNFTTGILATQLYLVTDPEEAYEKFYRKIKSKNDLIDRLLTYVS